MKESTRYRGIKKKRNGWEANIVVNGEYRYLGYYTDPKQAAKAYDFFVIRNNLNRQTNFLKKKLAINE